MRKLGGRRGGLARFLQVLWIVDRGLVDCGSWSGGLWSCGLVDYRKAEAVERFSAGSEVQGPAQVSAGCSVFVSRLRCDPAPETLLISSR